MSSKTLKALLCAVMAFISIESQAAGIGGYGMFGYGETFYNDPVIPFLNYGANGSYITGGGLVIDTNCSGSTIFNYRIAIGAAQSFSAKENERIEPAKTTRVQVLNTFGLGIVRREKFRLWMGPQVGFTTLYGTYRGDRGKTIMQVYPDGYIVFNPFFIDKIQYSMMGASFGLALGMNFNFRKSVTLMIEGSWRYDVFYGMMRQEYFMQDPFSYHGYINTSHSSWVKAFTDGLYLSLGIMFRFGESAVDNNTGIYSGGLK